MLIFKMPNADGPRGTAAALRAAYDSPGFIDILPGYGDFPRPDTSPGSDGVSPGATEGPVIGTPVVSSVYVSTQTPEGMQTVPVTNGDTSSFSDDQPIHDGTPLLAGGSTGNAPDRTGAGEGKTGHFAHPDNQNQPMGSVQ